MLTLSTNLLLWLLAVVNDSVHRESDSSDLNSTSDDYSVCTCPQFSTCWTFQRGYVTLYPFNLEYSLVCASMLFIMWRNVGRKDVLHSGTSHHSFRLQGVLYGPVLGTVSFVVGLCIFIQYQIQATAGVTAQSSFILYYGFSDTLLPIMVISCFIGIIAQTYREKNCVEVTENNSEHSEDSGEKGRENYVKKCRHRKCKNHGQWEGDTGEHKETRGEEDKCHDQEEHKVEQDSGCQDREGQSETGKTNETFAMQELEIDEKTEHREPNQHRRKTKRKFSVEKNDHEDSDDHKYTSHPRPPKNYSRSLEITLLLGAAFGQFSISYYSVVAIVATGSWNLLNCLNLTYSLLMVLQHMFQNVFIIEGMTKEHKGHIHPKAIKENKEEQEEGQRRMSMMEIRRVSVAYLENIGRLSVSRRLVKEVALFLVFCNFIFWVMSAFGDHPQFTNGLEREFYGSNAWFSILNFGLPLSVFYRMHSVGGLLEVYVTA